MTDPESERLSPVPQKLEASRSWFKRAAKVVGLAIGTAVVYEIGRHLGLNVPSMLTSLHSTIGTHISHAAELAKTDPSSLAAPAADHVARVLSKVHEAKHHIQTVHSIPLKEHAHHALHKALEHAKTFHEHVKTLFHPTHVTPAPSLSDLQHSLNGTGIEAHMGQHGAYFTQHVHAGLNITPNNNGLGGPLKIDLDSNFNKLPQAVKDTLMDNMIPHTHTDPMTLKETTYLSGPYDQIQDALQQAGIDLSGKALAGMQHMTQGVFNQNIPDTTTLQVNMDVVSRVPADKVMAIVDKVSPEKAQTFHSLLAGLGDHVKNHMAKIAEHAHTVVKATKDAMSFDRG